MSCSTVLFSALLLFLSPTAQAIHGDDATVPELKGRTCLLASREKNKSEVLSLCTVNQVSPTGFLTAAHCVLTQAVLDGMLANKELDAHVDAANIVTNVFCGGFEHGRFVSSAQPLRNYKYQAGFAANDIAVLKIADKDALALSEEIRLAETLAETKSLIEKHVCRVVGFGRSDEGNTHTLHMTTPELPQSDFSRAGLENFIYLGHGGNSQKNAVDRGDSGGAVYCRGEDQHWKLVGINSMIMVNALPMATTVSSHFSEIQALMRATQ